MTTETGTPCAPQPTASRARRARRLALEALLLAVVVVLAWRRLAWLDAHPDPTDFDGYYYLQELRHRLAEGRGYYEAFSPFFATLTLLGRALGASPESLLRGTVVAALVGATVAAAALGAARRGPVAGAAAACIVLGSDVFFFLAFGLPRQAIAAALALGAAAVLGRMPGATRPRAFALVAGGLAALAIAVHPFGFVVAALGGLALLEDAPRRGRLLLVAGLGAVGIALLLPATREKLAGAVASLTLGDRLVWEAGFTHGAISAFERAEYFALFALAAAGLLLALLVRPRALAAAAVSGAMLVCLAPLWRQDFHGYGQRLARSAVLFVPLLVAALGRGSAPLVGAASGAVAPPRPAALGARLRGALPFALALTLTGGHGVWPSAPRPIGPPMPVALLRDHARVLDAWLPRDAFVLAPHGVQYRVTYFLGRAAAQRWPAGRDGRPRYALSQGRVRGRAPRQCVPAPALDPAAAGVDCVYLGRDWMLHAVE